MPTYAGQSYKMPRGYDDPLPPPRPGEPAVVPKLPTVPGELAAAIRRGKAEGRLGPEHRLDLARARQLVGWLGDPKTPRSSLAALDRRLDVVLIRLGFVTDATGPTELDEWLAGLVDDSATADTELDEGAAPLPPEVDRSD